MAIIAMSHHKGGAGKTTSSMHLVAEMKPDEIIDLDIHRGISVINSLRPNDNKLPVRVLEDKKPLLKWLEELDEQGKFVFVDCGGFDSDLTQSAIAVADLVIVPANDTITERIGLSLFDSTLDKISQTIGIDIQARLILCKTHPNKKRFPKMDDLLIQTKHIQRLNSVLSYRNDFTETLEDGMGITESVYGRGSAAGRELKALVDEIKFILKSME